MSEDALARKIEAAISEITVGGGGMIRLYPTTLASELSPDLLRKIARTAAKIAIEEPR